MKNDQKDILVIDEKNTEKCEFKNLIIGDIHGEIKTLDDLFEKTIIKNHNNRLFFVGDLTDRGDGSLFVINHFLFYMDQFPDRIFVTRGNHEDLCLRIIDCFEKLLIEFKEGNAKEKANEIKKQITAFVDDKEAYEGKEMLMHIISFHVKKMVVNGCWI